MKYWLAKVRWGDNLTWQDLEFLNDLTFFEVFRSSYLLPHSAYSRNIPRR